MSLTLLVSLIQKSRKFFRSELDVLLEDYV
jgi:hypothetical protein